MLKTLKYEIKSASKIQSPLQLIAEAHPAHERKDEEDKGKLGNAVRKAKEVRGYYSDDDVKILLDALLNKKGVDKAGELRDKEDVSFIADIFVASGKRTIVLAPIIEGEENIKGRVTQLKKDFISANNEKIDQILIPTNKRMSHWYTFKLVLSYNEGNLAKIEWFIHDSLYKRSKEDLQYISVNLESTILTSFGILKEQLIGHLSLLPLIQRGVMGGAVNCYCGGYTARLISNLVMDPDLDQHDNIQAWSCPDNRDIVLREEDTRIVEQYNSRNAGNFGTKPMYASEAILKAQEASLLRNFIASEVARQILEELKVVYESISIDTKAFIKAIVIPKDSAALSGLIRDLYRSLPLLKVLFQATAEGEIVKDADGLLKLDTNLEIEHIYNILKEVKRTCFSLEGIEVEALDDKEVVLEDHTQVDRDGLDGYSYLLDVLKLNAADLEQESELLELRDEFRIASKPNKYPNDLIHYLGSIEICKSKFIGRTEELKAIGDKLESTKIVIIRGVPGVGKTAIARHYVHTTQDHTPIWFNADSVTSLARSYREFGRSLGVDLDKQEDGAVMRIINNKISSAKQEILFIFDNLEANYANHYIENLPDNVRLLITTRHDSSLDNLEDEIRLDHFSQEEAGAYLKYNGIKQNEIELLVNGIGTIPKPLSLAVGYLKDNKAKTVQDILTDLKEKNIYEIVMGKLIEEQEAEWELLQYIAWLKADFIPIEILSGIANKSNKNLLESIRKLEKLSLINVVERDDNIGLEVHREVQDETVKYINKYPNKSKDQSQLATNLLQLLNRFLPAVTRIPDKKWTKAKLYLSSIEAVFEQITSSNINLINSHDIAILNLKLGMSYAEMFRDFKKALVYKEQSLKIMQDLYKSSHHDIACVLNNVGIAYEKLGDINKGLNYQEQALKMYQELYFDNHPSIATVLNNIGCLYEELGDVKKGLEHYDQALKMRQALYSDNHHDVAISLSKLGCAYIKLNDVKNGFVCYMNALKIRQTLYPGDHHDVAASFNNIGAACYAVGNIKRSLEFYERALKMMYVLYPVEHPDLATSLNNVGTAYDALGDVGKALEHYERALKMMQILYTGAHHEVAISLNNVGTAYGKLGDTRKGLDYKVSALKMLQSLYSGGHHYVANSLNDVGMAYEDLGDIKKGLEYYNLALKMRQALYPDNHPSIAHSLNNIGCAYEELGDVRKGLHYKERALKVMQSLYPSGHHDVATSLNNVGLMYETLGDLEKCLYYLEQALQMRHALYLDDPHLVAESLNNLALTYKDLGDIGKYNLYVRQAVSLKGFITKRGRTSQDVIKIRKKIQKILNTIQVLSAEGIWSNQATSLHNLGISSYLKENYLKKQLGELYNAQNLKAARALCFEAINIGIVNSGQQKLICTTRFAKSYPLLIDEIVSEHPEYFITENIAKSCLTKKEYNKLLKIASNNFIDDAYAYKDAPAIDEDVRLVHDIAQVGELNDGCANDASPVGQHATHKLSSEEKKAIDYLTGNGIKKSNAELIVSRIGIIPQYLALAVGYLKENGEKNIADLVVAEKTIFEISIGWLATAGHSDEWALLQRLAWLDPEFTSYELLLAIERNDQDKLRRTIEILERLAFVGVTRRGEVRGITISTELQEQIAKYATGNPHVSMATSQLLVELLGLLNKFLPTITDKPDKAWEMAKTYVPIVESMLQNTASRGVLISDTEEFALLNAKLGEFYWKISINVKKSLDYKEKALAIYQSIYKEPHLNVASSLDNLGNTYTVLGYADKSLTYFEQALQILQALSQGNPHVAINMAFTFNCIGFAYYQLGDIGKCLDHYERGLAIMQDLYQDNHHNVAISLNNVGSAYQKLGEVRKGLDYQERALVILQGLYQGNHPDVAKSLNNVGGIYLELSYMQKGLDYKERALAMVEALYHGNHPYVAAFLNNVGFAYKISGDIRKGLHYYERGLAMRQALYPGNHPDIAASLNNIGIAHQKLGNVGNGLDYQERGLKMLRCLYPGNHPDVAALLSNVGSAYETSGKAKKGLEYKERSLRMYQAIYPGNHPDVADLLDSMGDAYQASGKVSKGLGYKKQAEEMRVAIRNAAQEDHVVQQFKGQGTLAGTVDSRFEYYNNGIDQILKLRINRLRIEANPNVLRSLLYYTKQSYSAVGRLVKDVISAFSSEKAQMVLAPVNLHNKHWIGLLFRDLGGVVEITYMDSEQGVMVSQLRNDLERSFAMNGYKGRFLELRLERQRYNNCGSELLENFVYYLTGTRSTQEGAIYLHSLLLENSLLDPIEYQLKIAENSQLIGLLSNTAPVPVEHMPILHGVRSPVITFETTGQAIDVLQADYNSLVGFFNNLIDKLNLNFELKKFLYRSEVRRFNNILRAYNIRTATGSQMSASVLRDYTIFKKSVLFKLHPDKGGCKEDFTFVKDLEENFRQPIDIRKLIGNKIQAIQPLIDKTNVGFKVLDVTVDIARLRHEPTLHNLNKAIFSSAHLYSMHYGVNGFSTFISSANLAQQIYQGDYGQAFITATIYLALPFGVARINNPYLNFAHSIAMTGYIGYSAIANAYSFCFGNDPDFVLRSTTAYKGLTSTLSKTPLQLLYDFSFYTQKYELQISDILFEKEKLDAQTQLKEKGEFGQKLFDYIYLPAITEKYTLLNNVIKGIITAEKAEALRIKPITITFSNQTYDYCIEIKALENSQDAKHYYCYNDKQQLVEHVLIGDNNHFEILKHLEV